MIITIKESNKKIIDLIKSKETFLISRLGYFESLLTIEYVITNNRSLYPILDNNNKNWVNCYDQFSSDNIIEVKKNNIVLSSFKKAN